MGIILQSLLNSEIITYTNFNCMEVVSTVIQLSQAIKLSVCAI